MLSNKDYLLDKEFLQKLAHEREKETYIKIISYDTQGNPQSTLEGLATGGSINIDGNSSVRRSCSLSLVSDINENQDLFFDFYWSLSTQFELFIGLKNIIDIKYPDIVWFPLGWYIISSFNQNEEGGKVTTNISGKDKMCRLNGENGGTFTGLTNNLSKGYNKDGEEVYITIKEIITNLVSTFGEEELYNIIINDLDKELGLELLEYRGDTPLYLFENNDGGIDFYTSLSETKCFLNGNLTTLQDPNIRFKKLTSSLQIQEPSYIYMPASILELISIEDQNYNIININPSSEDEQKYSYIANVLDDTYYIDVYDNTKKYIVIKLEYGEIAGYKLLNEGGLVYAQDLMANLGDSVTSILDKLIKMLGNYEYFYNLDGQFVFQKKKNLVSITRPEEFLISGNNNDLIFDLLGYEEMTQFEFNNDELLVSKRSNYNLNNIKNDFAIWGKRDNQDIFLRYAIDKKPIEYTTYDFKGNDKLPPRASSVFTTDNYDWREILYQMAYDYINYRNQDDFYEWLEDKNPNLIKNGKTGYEKYYTDIYSFWRDIYNPNPQPIYTRIPYETASQKNWDKIYTHNIIKYNANTHKQKIDITSLYELDSTNSYFTRWIDKQNFITDSTPFYNLYYYQGKDLIPLMDLLNNEFKTRIAYLDNEAGQKISLLDSLGEEEWANIYVSDREYSQKYPYINYIDVNTYTNNYEDYGDTTGPKLYAKIQNNNIYSDYEVEYVQLSYKDSNSEEKTLYIWYHEDQENIPSDQIKMLNEALKSYAAQMTIAYKIQGEEAEKIIKGNSVGFNGFYIRAKRAAENKILWYYVNEKYEYLNLYFLKNQLNSTDDNTKFHLKNETYFLINGAYYNSFDLLDIDKAKIYLKNLNNSFNLYISQIEWPNDADNLYVLDENLYMPIPLNDSDVLKPILTTEYLISPYYMINGTNSVYYQSKQKKQINKYYEKSYAYNYDENSNDYRNCWHLDIYNNFNKSKFWFDFLDTNSDIQRFSVPILGDRIKTINNNQITGFDYDIPNYIYYSGDLSSNTTDYTNIQMTEKHIEEYFKLSKLGYGALEEVSIQIDQLLKSNANLSISNIPLYWLDVNQQVFMDKYYEIKRITIPLAYNGKMTMELIPLE